MTARQRVLAPKTRNGAHYGYTSGGLNGLANHPLLAGGPDSVENDAGEVEIRIEMDRAQHRGGGGPRHLGDVDDENHRGAEELGQGCSGVAPGGVDTVEEAAVALHQDEVGAGCSHHAATDSLVLHEKRIEVVTRAAGGSGQPRRVDVVRTLFEGLDHSATIGQRPAQAETDQGLPAIAGQSGDHQPWGSQLHLRPPVRPLATCPRCNRRDIPPSTSCTRRRLRAS